VIKTSALIYGHAAIVEVRVESFAKKGITLFKGTWHLALATVMTSGTYTWT
jgi:hypothetical protein